MIYYLGTTGEIIILDPAAPGSPRQTGISVPPGSKALAIGHNKNAGPNPTYYTVGSVGGGTPALLYYNGTQFVTTGFTMNVDHLTGSCDRILGLDCLGGGFVYAWQTAPVPTGTPPFPGAPTYATQVATGLGSCDITGDCSGGFWAINQNAPNPQLKHFNSAYANDETFAITGTVAPGNEGLAVIGNQVYYDGADNKLYTGTLNRTLMTVSFTANAATPFAFIGNQDFASCGIEGFCLPGNRDTVYACTANDDAVVNITATGAGPYNFRIIGGGPATIAITGNTATVRTRSNTSVAYLNVDCNGKNTVADTTEIIINNALIDAGPNDTIIGCRGVYLDTLRGTIRDTTRGLFWAYDWSPLTGMLAGNTTLDSAIIAPRACVKYYLTVTTNTRCQWRDSVTICVADSTPRPRFIYDPHLGCEEDTVRFINTTATNVYTNSTLWRFGDGNQSTELAPTHIYKDQGIYNVTLIMSNRYCTDSVTGPVDVLHTLIARFDASDTTTCANLQLRFTDKSTFSRGPAGIDPIYRFDFGDGTTSTQSTPTHTYTTPGTYIVKMRIQDYLGCADSVSRTIVVDTVPYALFVTPDTLICEGQAVNLFADYSEVGNTGLSFDLGDGAIFDDVDTVRYAFKQPGTYNVKLTAQYRICPDAVFSRTITVNPFPGVYIGQDTVLCPNGAPIALTDRLNVNNPDARYLWSTGDTTASILARDIGTYWARVTLAGCSGTDSLTVNKDCYVDIPNVFSPNSDRTNEYFYPRQMLSRSVSSFKMTIYNRWGQTIFETTSLDGRGWDGRFNGKDQPQGVYVYIIDVSFDNGVKEHYTGNVTLLR